MEDDDKKEDREDGCNRTSSARLGCWKQLTQLTQSNELGLATGAFPGGGEPPGHGRQTPSQVSQTR
jgi:hypothetical protein